MKIAIASGKGGTGKTTLSVNLASFLSEKYQHVFLADMDVEEPNCAVFIKGNEILKQKQYKDIPQWIKDKCTFYKTCQEVCNFNAIAVLPGQVLIFPELCHACHACVGLCPENALKMHPHEIGACNHYKMDNLQFIEGKLKIGEQQAPPLIAKVKNYIETIAPDDSILIFDSPPGTSCPMIEVVKDADFVILVTEPTPFGLHDLKLSIDTLKKLGKTFGVVINRVDDQNNIISDHCKQEGIEVIEHIPDSRKIAENYATGALLYKNMPEIAHILENIKNNIFEKQHIVKQ
jgi:MinD superfamily P-loop ATPase